MELIFEDMASLYECFISEKNWLAEWPSFVPVDPNGSVELEPMTTKCQIGGKDDNQEIKVTKNLQQV